MDESKESKHLIQTHESRSSKIYHCHRVTIQSKHPIRSRSDIQSKAFHIGPLIEWKKQKSWAYLNLKQIVAHVPVGTDDEQRH